MNTQYFVLEENSGGNVGERNGEADTGKAKALTVSEACKPVGIDLFHALKSKML